MTENQAPGTAPASRKGFPQFPSASPGLEISIFVSICFCNILRVSSWRSRFCATAARPESSKYLTFNILQEFNKKLMLHGATVTTMLSIFYPQNIEPLRFVPLIPAISMISIYRQGGEGTRWGRVPIWESRILDQWLADFSVSAARSFARMASDSFCSRMPSSLCPERRKAVPSTK